MPILHKFKRRKIKDAAEESSMEALLNLYKESEALDNQSDREIPAVEDTEQSFASLIKARRHSQHWRWLIWSFVSFLIVVGSCIGGWFYLFGNSGKFDDKSVELVVSGPDQVAVGQEAVYVVQYNNKSTSVLNNSRILVQYPHGFQLEKTEPMETEHSWQLGTLQPGNRGEIKITGRLVDSLTEAQKITLRLIYEPSEFRSEFAREESFATTLQPPTIEVVSNYSVTASLGQKITLKTKFHNKGEENIPNFKYRITYPSAFVFVGSKPAAYEGQNTWLVTDLIPEAVDQELQLEGNFPATMIFANDEERNQSFKTELFMPGAGNEYVLVREETFQVRVIDQAVSTYLIINGSTENKNINLGDSLTFSVIAKNNGQETYANTGVKAIIKPTLIDIIDWGNIQDEKFGKIQKTTEGKEIFWDKSQISDLGNFKPGTEVTINFVLPVKKYTDFKVGDITSLSAAKISSLAEFSFTKDDEGKETIPPIKSSAVDLSLNTDANFTNRALYYDDEGVPKGRGPLPPVAGQTTTVQVEWALANHLHEIKDIVMTTTLPLGVNFADNDVTVGELNYSEADRTITWTINRLPLSVEKVSANFALQLTPGKKDIGNIMKLTGTATLTAKDSVTDENIIKSTSILTTALDGDDMAAGRGMVLQGL